MKNFDMSLHDVLMFLATGLFRFDRSRADQYAKTFEFCVKAHAPRVKQITAAVSGSQIHLRVQLSSGAADFYGTLKTNLSMYFAPTVVSVEDGLGVVDFKVYPQGSDHQSNYVYSQIAIGPRPLLF